MNSTIMSELIIEEFEDTVNFQCSDRKTYDQLMQKTSLDNLVRKHENKKWLIFYLNGEKETAIHIPSYKFL